MTTTDIPYSERPYTHRGYRWTADELELFRQFKRQGAIARQARPQRYAIDIDHDDNIHLWMMVRRGWRIYERHIASMPLPTRRSYPPVGIPWPY